MIPRPRQFARPNPNHVDQRKRTTTNWNKIWRDTNCDYLREVVAAHVACTVALDRMAARYRYIYVDTDICAGYRHNYVDGTRQTHQSQPSRFQIVRLDMHERAPRFRRNKFVRSIVVQYSLFLHLSRTWRGIARSEMGGHRRALVASAARTRVRTHDSAHARSLFSSFPRSIRPAPIRPLLLYITPLQSLDPQSLPRVGCPIVSTDRCAPETEKKKATAPDSDIMTLIWLLIPFAALAACQ